MFRTGLLRKNLDVSAPCFAIRIGNADDLSLMVDAVPREVWNLVSAMFEPEDIATLFSTCKGLKACFENHVVEAEQRYAQSAEKILSITNDRSFTDKRAGRKLTKFLGKNDLVKVLLSECERKLDLLTALGLNKSIKLLHIEAKNIARYVDGQSFGLSFENFPDATIELDLAKNNLWPDSCFKQVFYSVLASNSVRRLNLDCNNFKSISRSEAFFHMLFSSRSRLSDLSLVGNHSQSCLSDFGMSLLAYGLMFNQPLLLKTIDLSNTSVKPGPVPYPKDFGQFIFPLYNENLNSQSFHTFSRTALLGDKKSGLQLIIESLKKNRTITSINLSTCQIDDKMAKFIAASLHENTTLQTLILGNNLIKSKGISTLAKAIRNHPSLENLILSSNRKIEKSGWIDFFSVLADNASLRHLDLNSCAIGDKEVVTLAASLKTNSTLKELILSNNRITVVGMTELAKSLNGHPSIRLLDLAGNQLSLKHVTVLEHLVSNGIQVRVKTDSQYRVAKANGTSLGTLPELNGHGEVDASEDIWLETSW